jgi:methionyl aminopeptidase
MNSSQKESFEQIRVAGNLAASALDEVTPYVQPGVTTSQLDKICYEFIRDNGGFSAPLFYRGFPKSCCTSANHVVCHGIPADKFLKEGDIINIDVTSIVNGWHGDTSRMYYVGEVSVKAKKLVESTYKSLMKSISILKPNIYLGDIGHVIQNEVELEGFSVVKDFCGHGIGKTFHKMPNVLHYGKKGTGEKLVEGMIFTVEPMINAGNFETKTLNDGWTAVSKDKSLSAQFEHTVGITKDGYEIFTQSNKFS